MKNRYKICGDYTIIYLDRRSGEPFETFIDTEDLDKIQNFAYKFTASKFRTPDDYYALATIYLGIKDGIPRYSTVRLSRIVMDCVGNRRVVVDHRNYDTLDNRKNNLRVSSIDKNVKHRGRLNKNNTSGYRNVTWSESYKKWIVQLQINHKNKILGKFDDKDEAGKFAAEMRALYYGEFAGK